MDNFQTSEMFMEEFQTESFVVHLTVFSLTNICIPKCILPNYCTLQILRKKIAKNAFLLCSLGNNFCYDGFFLLK